MAVSCLCGNWERCEFFRELALGLCPVVLVAVVAGIGGEILQVAGLAGDRTLLAVVGGQGVFLVVAGG
jgi:hypothetical protein